MLTDHFAIRVDDVAGQRSERPSAACRCARSSRLAVGANHFLPEAREMRPYQASAPPKASSAWRALVFRRLASRTRSVDRTRSPVGVSQKREYFKYQPE